MSHRIARGLDYENVAATNVLLDLDINLAIGELAEVGLAERDPEMIADFASKIGVGSTRKDFELIVLAGASRFRGGFRFRSLLFDCHSTHGVSCDWRAGWRDVVRRVRRFNCARLGSCFHQLC